MNFQPGNLPVVAAREIYGDLKQKAEQESSCSPDILFALAGSHFNGSIADIDEESGLAQLARAAEGGEINAIAVVHNVFDSCNRTLGTDLQALVKKSITSRGPNLVMGLLAEVRKPRSSMEYRQVLAETWLRFLPDDYAAYMGSKSRRSLQAPMTYFLYIMTESWASPGNSIFDFSQLDCWRGEKAYLPSSELDLNTFVEEVAALKCQNRYGKYGMTLLQHAVVHQDRVMLSTLIDQLGADVDNFGNTPGWTPFWLSCLFGDFDIATLLLQKGTSTKCLDLETGVTILHMLNTFSGIHHIETILQAAMKENGGSLDLECVSLETRLTPLHATFFGWDFSRGSAARALLKLGANPCASAPYDADFFTPIGLCMLRLDYPLLECMLSCPWIMSRKNDPAAMNAVAKAKGQAFRALVAQTEFYCRGFVGKDWQLALDSVLRLIVDKDMLSEFDRDPLVEAGNDPLRVAINLSRTHVAEALLRLFPFPVGATPRSVNRRPYLHAAIERRLRGCVRALIAGGASVFSLDQSGQTAFHATAHYFPSFLLELIELADQMSPEQRGGRSIKQILEMRDTNGFNVLGILLMEGYESERKMTESLRTKYEIDLDAMQPFAGSDEITLTGAMIGSSMVHGLVPVEQIKYLLKFSPPPRFVCMGGGVTLLELAVSGYMGRKWLTLADLSKTGLIA